MEQLKKCAEFIKERPRIILAVGLIGILLIFGSTVIDSGSSAVPQPSETAISAQQYAQTLERQLCDAIGHITKGGVSVMVTLESDIEYIYASEVKADKSLVEERSGSKQQQDDSNQSSLVIVKDEHGNEQPLVVTAVMPRVKGVAVNCEGADNEQTAAAVKSLVCTALGISDARVCVLGYNN